MSFHNVRSMNSLPVFTALTTSSSRHRLSTFALQEMLLCWSGSNSTEVAAQEERSLGSLFAKEYSTIALVMESLAAAAFAVVAVGRRLLIQNPGVRASACRSPVLTGGFLATLLTRRGLRFSLDQAGRIHEIHASRNSLDRPTIV
jgi:hypothetical protein